MFYLEIEILEIYILEYVLRSNGILVCVSLSVPSKKQMFYLLESQKSPLIWERITFHTSRDGMAH